MKFAKTKKSMIAEFVFIAFSKTLTYYTGGFKKTHNNKNAKPKSHLICHFVQNNDAIQSSIIQQYLYLGASYLTTNTYDMDKKSRG